MKQKLTIDAKKIPALVGRYQMVIAIVTSLIVLGYTSYQISQMYGVEPHAEYLTTKKEEQKSVRIQSDSKTLKQLRALQNSELTPASSSARDPFEL